MEVVSYLNEYTSSSTFSWRVENFNKIDWTKGFVIKSKEITFPEANAVWHITLSPLVCKTGNFLMSKFFLKDSSGDENAKYKFDITLKGLRIFFIF